MSNDYKFKWMLQRITAILLIPLSFWFIYQCISFQKLNYFELKFFFESYLNSLLFLFMMAIMLIHAKLGCETIIEDYISTSFLKKFFKRFLNLSIFFSLFLVIIAILNLSILR